MKLITSVLIVLLVVAIEIGMICFPHSIYSLICAY